MCFGENRGGKGVKGEYYYRNEKLWVIKGKMKIEEIGIWEGVGVVCFDIE